MTEWTNECILAVNLKVIQVETLKKEQLKDNITLMYL